MKFRDLILMDFVNDRTIFTTSRPISGSVCDIKKGQWFQDHMLNLAEYEVEEFNYDSGMNILTAALVPPSMEE